MATLFRTAISTASRMTATGSTSSVYIRSMATGTTKWFNVKKGFGFITPDETGAADVFVHQSAIQAQGFRFLKDGEKVSYELEKTDRGVQAKNVRDGTGSPFKRVQTTPRKPTDGNSGAPAQ